MGKIQKCIGFVFLCGMLALGDVQNAEGNTNLGTSYSGTELYGYQSFSQNQGAQLFYEDLDAALSGFLDEKKDVVLNDGALFCAVTNVNYKQYGLSPTEAQIVYESFTYDHPEYYWLANSYSYSATSIYIMMNPEYRLASVRDKYEKKLGTVVDYVISQTRNMSDDETVSFIHDMIIENTNYAYKSGTKIPVEEEWAHCITGYLDKKGVVCEGYAKTFQLLLNRVGIENVFVTGTSRKENHAWNIVKMDDEKWYWFDLTWDDRDLADASQNRIYYAMPDSLFRSDHTPNGGPNHKLYDLPTASDEYTYYCTSGIQKLQNATESQMVTALQEAVLAEVKRGGNCAVFQFPSKKDYDAFSKLMFTGFSVQGGSVYYYDMYLKQVPELQEYLGDQYDFQLVGDYLYFYFSKTKEMALPAVNVYENDEFVGSYGTIQEAFTKMKDVNADYEIIYKNWAPMQMLPKSVKIPKVHSVSFYGCEGTNGQVSFLFLPEDLVLTCNVTVKNMCLMGIKTAATKLNLNGYTMTAAGKYVYIGNTGNPNKQAVQCVNGEIVVDDGTQMFAVEELNVAKLTLENGNLGSWAYLRGGGSIETFNGLGENDYLVVYENPVTIQNAKGEAYIFPSGDSTYNCSVDNVAKDASLGVIIYPKSDSKISVRGKIEGDVLAMYDVAGEPSSDYAKYTRKKHIYAPNATEDQITCLVKKKTAFEYTDWALEKQSDGYFTIVFVEKDASGNVVKKKVDTPDNVKNPKPGQDADSVEIPDAAEDTLVVDEDGYLEVGTKINDKPGATYKVVEDKDGEACVSYSKPKDGAKGKITVPDTVEYGGMTYKVVEVEAKAFKKNKKIKEVKLGENVTKIGKEAFSGCSKLKKITIRSTSLKSVGKNACKGIHKKAVVKVPKSKLKQYQKLFKKKGLSKTAKVKK